VRGIVRIGRTPHLASVHAPSWDRQPDHQAPVPTASREPFETAVGADRNL
jgi:hypothetical protein